MPSARGGGTRCASRIARCSGTSVTRAGTTTGIVSSSDTRSARAVPRVVRRRAPRLRTGAAGALRERPGARLAGAVRQRVRQRSPLGGLGRDLGPLPAHDRHARNRGGVRLSLRPRRADEPSLQKVPASVGTPDSPFDRLIDSWYPLTYMLNSLNRGMGLADAYPFVLSAPAVEKLRFVHEIIAAGDPDEHDRSVPSCRAGLVRRDIHRADRRPAAAAGPRSAKADATLIAAPTGSGKTLAAFLMALDDLVAKACAARCRTKSASSTSRR